MKVQKEKIELIKKFIKGDVELEEVMEELKVSRATVYRYAKTVHEGKEIVDRRQFGNNRKYGKKQ